MAEAAEATETTEGSAPSAEALAEADRSFEQDLARAGLFDDAPSEWADEPKEEPKAETPATDPKATPNTPADPKPVAKATEKPATEQKPGDKPAETPEKPEAVTDWKVLADELASKVVPASYTLDGQQKSVDWMHEVPGEGVLIEQANVGRFKNFLQAADSALQRVPKLQQDVNRLGAVGYTEKQFGPDGKESGTKEYRGMEAVGVMRANLEASEAMSALFLSAFMDNNALARLATDPDAKRNFLERTMLTGTRTIDTARRSFSEGIDKQMAVQNEGPIRERNRAATIADRMAETRKALPDLTDEDMADAQRQFAPFTNAMFRPATAQEAAALRIPVGTEILDWTTTHPWFEARAQLRTTQKAEAVARTKAEQENAARLTAATPPSKPPVARRGAGRTTSQQEREPSWSEIKKNWSVGHFAVDSGE